MLLLYKVTHALRTTIFFKEWNFYRFLISLKFLMADFALTAGMSAFPWDHLLLILRHRRGKGVWYAVWFQCSTVPACQTHGGGGRWGSGGLRGGCKFDMLDHYSQEDTIAGHLVEMIQNNSKPKAKKLTY